LRNAVNRYNDPFELPQATVQRGKVGHNLLRSTLTKNSRSCGHFQSKVIPHAKPLSLMSVLMCVSLDSEGTTMKPNKKNKLEAADWKVGNTIDFLGLSADEAAYIELKLALSDQLRKRRLKKKLTQIEVAQIVASSQSRVAKMESGDSTVTVDLLVKSPLALGAARKELATAIAA
jgi:Helix-turn-helix